MSGWCGLTSCNGGTTAGPGDKTLGEWFVWQVGEHARQHGGERLIDYFDNHFYPSATGVNSDADDILTRILRLRAPASLLDSGYVDESWIEKPLAHLPTMQRYIDAAGAPWLRISVGEHAWGGDALLSTALAEAEALGVFGQFGVAMAMRWEAPAVGSAVEGLYRLLLGTGGAERGGTQPTAAFLGEVAAVEVAPPAAGGAQHLRAFAATTDAGAGRGRVFQALLLCKYPVAGADCAVELKVDPALWGVACPPGVPAVAMAGVEPCAGQRKSCAAAGFTSVANTSLAAARGLGGALVVRHVVPALSAHILQLRCAS
jgi:hypothetical protein